MMAGSCCPVAGNKRESTNWKPGKKKDKLWSSGRNALMMAGSVLPCGEGNREVRGSKKGVREGEGRNYVARGTKQDFRGRMDLEASQEWTDEVLKSHSALAQRQEHMHCSCATGRMVLPHACAVCVWAQGEKVLKLCSFACKLLHFPTLS